MSSELEMMTSDGCQPFVMQVRMEILDLLSGYSIEGLMVKFGTIRGLRIL